VTTIQHVCDGCGADLHALSPTMVHPAPADLFGDGVVYTVCPPDEQGRQPCLDVAKLEDELVRRARCTTPACDGLTCTLGGA
jgi:hypothetical protein